MGAQMRPQALQELADAVESACEVYGPRVVGATVLAQVVRHAQQHGDLDDALAVLRGWQLDLEARRRDIVTAARTATPPVPWPTIARALGLATREAVQRYGAADPKPPTQAGRLGRLGQTERDQPTPES
jgi:hypothetical protein